MIDKKPLLIIYNETSDDMSLELSKEISFLEKMALLTFLKLYIKDLENAIRDSFEDVEDKEGGFQQMRKGRPSDNEILVKLETLKKSAQDHNCFSVAMKFDIRIQEHKKKRIKKVYKK